MFREWFGIKSPASAWMGSAALTEWPPSAHRHCPLPAYRSETPSVRLSLSSCSALTPPANKAALQGNSSSGNQHPAPALEMKAPPHLMVILHPACTITPPAPVPLRTTSMRIQPPSSPPVSWRLLLHSPVLVNLPHLLFIPCQSSWDLQLYKTL